MLIDDILLRTRCERPYYAIALAALTPIPKEDVPTIGVDKYWRLYYNEEYLSGLTPAEQVVVLEHELNHLLRRHPGRAEALSIEGMRANIAGDAEINDDLQGLPADCITPSSLGAPDGLTMEEYLKYIKTVECSNSCSGGSGAGNPQPWEEPGGGSGDKDDQQPQITEAQADSIRISTAQRIKEHADKNPGTVPAGLLMWADDNAGAEPDIPWHLTLGALLQGHVSEWIRGRVDYSFRRPSRRQRPMQPIRPASVGAQPSIGVVVDVSGSMMGHGSDVLGTLQAIGRRFTEITTYAQQVHEPVKSKGIPKEWIGGGGTDLRPAIEMADNDGHACVLVVTDTYTPWPAEPTAHPMIVVAVEGTDVPEWATTVRVGR